MNATATAPNSSPTVQDPEVALFRAFCDRCGRNPLDWSMQTRRQFRKAIRHTRKCCAQGGAR